MADIGRSIKTPDALLSLIGDKLEAAWRHYNSIEGAFDNLIEAGHDVFELWKKPGIIEAERRISEIEAMITATPARTATGAVLQQRLLISLLGLIEDGDSTQTSYRLACSVLQVLERTASIPRRKWAGDKYV